MKIHSIKTYSYKCPYYKRVSHMNNLMLYLKELEKEEHTKAKIAKEENDKD